MNEALVLCGSSRALKARLPDIQALHSSITLLAPPHSAACSLRENDHFVEWSGSRRITRDSLRDHAPELVGRRWARVHLVAPEERGTEHIRLLLAALLPECEEGCWHWGPWAPPWRISLGVVLGVCVRKVHAMEKMRWIAFVESGLRRFAELRFGIKE